jgi:hypothetical protein
MPATFDTFQTELARLVDSFAHNLAEHKNPAASKLNFATISSTHSSPPSAGASRKADTIKK